VNTNVATPPSVRVTDKFDNPIQGHSVTFAVTGSNGTVSPTTPLLTLADGTATLTSWTVGTLAATASDTVEVTPAGGAVVPNPLRYTATATPGAATSFLVFQGNGQTAITGANVATAPGVRVADAYGNGIPGLTVNFSASGSGSVGTPAAVTNANGVATTTWSVNVGGHSMGTTGTYQNTLTASRTGFSNLQLSGFAIYSYATHVTNVFDTNCTSCHGFSAFTLSYASLVDVVPLCNSGYRRVSPAGGTTGANLSLLLIYLTPGAVHPSGCSFAHLEYGSASDPSLLTMQAWIRNGAPSN
jgi:hypothetical protein